MKVITDYNRNDHGIITTLQQCKKQFKILHDIQRYREIEQSLIRIVTIIIIKRYFNKPIILYNV